MKSHKYIVKAKKIRKCVCEVCGEQNEFMLLQTNDPDRLPDMEIDSAFCEKHARGKRATRLWTQHNDEIERIRLKKAAQLEKIKAVAMQHILDGEILHYYVNGDGVMTVQVKVNESKIINPKNVFKPEKI